MIFDHYGLEEIEEYLKDIIDDIRHGYSEEQIAAKLSLVDFDELFSVAHARIRNERERKIKNEGLFYTMEDLRFATNDLVARYRAKRLKCDTLVEVGTGVGIQTIAFAEGCKQVYSIEVNKRKMRYAQENLKQMGITNVTLIEGDAVKVVGQIPKADIVFCETERTPEEKERTLANLKPNVRELLKVYGALTSNFCIELPPQMRSIDLPGEKEYISVNGNINRLNLYQGTLQKAECSALLLPSNHRLELRKSEKMRKMPASKKLNKYLYEVDEAVSKAGMIEKLSQKGLYQYEEFLTSNTLVQSPFFRASYDITWKGPYDCQKIIDYFRKQKIGKVILRMNLSPEKYWDERNKFERNLTGERSMHLFVFGKEAYVGRVL